ncbi:hypothetical protein [Alienimonas chondri]|uniref:Esterase-like activity of phytase family protein n=1 Tax=Alienimonas chondri TaxID=2681879 RepID=A0ABX1VE81_9PLAN|nr:hypothetical protein [Alienimonas chondri]NNJ25351.1 hypothetical protein [Alienimonas chondri]
MLTPLLLTLLSSGPPADGAETPCRDRDLKIAPLPEVLHDPQSTVLIEGAGGVPLLIEHEWVEQHDVFSDRTEQTDRFLIRDVRADGKIVGRLRHGVADPGRFAISGDGKRLAIDSSEGGDAPGVTILPLPDKWLTGDGSAPAPEGEFHAGLRLLRPVRRSTRFVLERTLDPKRQGEPWKSEIVVAAGGKGFPEHISVFGNEPGPVRALAVDVLPGAIKHSENFGALCDAADIGDGLIVVACVTVTDNSKFGPYSSLTHVLTFEADTGRVVAHAAFPGSLGTLSCRVNAADRTVAFLRSDGISRMDLPRGVVVHQEKLEWPFYEDKAVADAVPCSDGYLVASFDRGRDTEIPGTLAFALFTEHRDGLRLCAANVARDVTLPDRFFAAGRTALATSFRDDWGRRIWFDPPANKTTDGE